MVKIQILYFQYRFSEMFQSRTVVTLDGYKYIWRATQEFKSRTNYPYNEDTHQFNCIV